MNKVTLLGNLVRDCEVRTTNSGKTVVSATIAVNRKSSSGKDVTAFVDLTLWEKRGEAFAKFHGKGTRALVHGRLDMDKWEDKDTGKPRSKLFVTVDDWSFVSNSGEPAAQPATGGEQPSF